MPSDHESSRSTYTRSLASGAVAGIAADLSLFPLDTLKTRLQSAQGFVAAGGFRGCYHGIGSAMLASAPSAAVFFVTYDSAKRFLTKHAAALSASSASSLAGGMSEAEARRRQKRLTVGAHMLAGCAGEIAGCIIRVPAEVVKQRAQAGQSGGRSWNAFTDILKTSRGRGPVRAVRELYRGAGVTLLRELPFTMIQFPLWEALKAWHVGRYGPASSHLSSASAAHNPGEAISAVPAALYGSLSGAVAAGITTPLDVLKTRLMLARERVGAVEMLRRIVQTSGPMALFAGLAPRTIWISLGGAIFLGSYQWTYNVLGERDHERSSY